MSVSVGQGTDISAITGGAALFCAAAGRLTLVEGRFGDLSDLADRPLDQVTLEIATERILDAMTALLADIRGESPPPERFRPGRRRSSDTSASDASSEGHEA